MTVAAIAFAALRFALWEFALFAAAIRLAGRLGPFRPSNEVCREASRVYVTSTLPQDLAVN